LHGKKGLYSVVTVYCHAGYEMCSVLKQRIRKHLLNASRQRHSSDDDEDTLGFVGEIDAVSITEFLFNILIV